MMSKCLFAFLVFWFTVASRAQSAPAPSGQVTYVLEPIAVSNVIYPTSAREQKIQGEIFASIAVSETGDVEYAKVFRGDPLLAKAAEDVASRWKFKPVTKEGKAIPVVTKATFNFVLGDGQEPKEIVPKIDPATDFPKRVRVSAGVSQGLLLSKISPPLPSRRQVGAYSGCCSSESLDRQRWGNRELRDD